MAQANLNSEIMTPTTPKAARWLTAALIAGSLLSATLGCSHPNPAQAPQAKANGEAQRAIVARAATAVTRMRQNPRFSSIDSYINQSRAIMIFPRLIKASVLFGGEGGNGVLVSRGPDGSWSNPAFYSLGSPSVGLQVGYQEATVILFIMDQKTLEQALDSSLTLGSSAGATLGTIGERDSTATSVDKPNVYQMVEAGGVYAGLSLEGYIIGARSKHNLEYYGQPRSPREIVIDGLAQRPNTQVLRNALATGPKQNGG